MLSDHDLDRVIDDAARELSAGEPSPALRARVMERLDDRRAWWLSPWVLSPVAIAAVLLVAAVIVRNREQPAPEQALLPSRSIERLAEVAGLEPHAAGLKPGAGLKPRATLGPDAGPKPRATSSAASSESEVAALAPPPLQLPSLALERIAPGESIQVPKLETITPIAVEPIGEPQGERR